MAAYYVAWTGVTRTTGAMQWAQSGYGRERNAGSRRIRRYRYAEMQGNRYRVNYGKGGEKRKETHCE